MKSTAAGINLPLRPEPFVFRLEFNPEASWNSRLIEEISASASIIQLEAAGPLTGEILDFLTNLDDRQESFSLRLLVRSDDEALEEYFGPLSRLKKLAALMLIIAAPAEEPAVSRLKGVLVAAASAGLKPGALIEPHPGTALPELKNFIHRVRQSGALEISLRPSLRAAFYSDNVFSENTLSRCLEELKNSGIPVALEECFPGIAAARHSNVFELSCRRGSGSCFIDYQGAVRVCRQSDKILGDLSKEKPRDIWQKFLFAEDVCPPAEISGCQEADGIDYRRCEKGKVNEEKKPSESSHLTPINLDSSLRPGALFTLREKAWGAVLIKGLDGQILSRRGAEIAALIDGRKTLSLFRKKFGLRGVQLVLALFLKGFVRLEK